MAHPAEVANDLEAHARNLDGTGFDYLAQSMRRGAQTIRNLLVTTSELEAAAQAEADRYEAYVYGDGK